MKFCVKKNIQKVSRTLILPSNLMLVIWKKAFWYSKAFCGTCATDEKRELLVTIKSPEERT